MKFSAQEEYGLRCLLQIARADASVTIPEISEREGLSQPNVAKLLMILRKEGIIASTRGQSGGYTLARPADQIVIGDILRALGGQLYDEDFCARHGHSSSSRGLCLEGTDCTVRSLWQTVQDAVDGVVNRLTLADMLKSKAPTTNVQMFDVPSRPKTLVNL